MLAALAVASIILALSNLALWMITALLSHRLATFGKQQTEINELSEAFLNCQIRVNEADARAIRKLSRHQDVHCQQLHFQQAASEAGHSALGAIIQQNDLKV